MVIASDPGMPMGLKALTRELLAREDGQAELGISRN